MVKEGHTLRKMCIENPIQLCFPTLLLLIKIDIRRASFLSVKVMLPLNWLEEAFELFD